MTDATTNGLFTGRIFAVKKITLASIVAALVLGSLFYVNNATRVAERPAVLRIGVLPDESPGILQRRYASLVEHLTRKTGIETRLVVPASYNDAVRLFANREVDLAYFGGFTFVQARERHNAEPLVMREVDTRFVSWFVTRPQYGERQLRDFRGSRLAFGSELSTSGHLMPRHFLLNHWQIDPEKFFSSIEYSGAHDKTVMMVIDGTVDIGAVNSVIVKKMINSGRIDGDAVAVVLETPPYPDYVWATQEFLDEALKTRLRNAFLELDLGDPEHGKILGDISAKAFLPADHRDFEVLRNIASRLGLMRDDS